MEVAELKMLRFSLGVTIMDNIRNEYTSGTAQVGRFGEKTRESILRWYGHVQRKEERPKMRFIYAVRKDMAFAEVTEDRIKGLRRPLKGKAERRRMISL